MNFNFPKLLISLDFELHWGRFDKYALEDCQPYYLNTIDTIPRLLELFQKYEIHVTWATVGSLLASNWEEWQEYAPKIPPRFKNQKYSAYHWIKKRNELPGLFAPDLVNLIFQTPGQEIGSHTFSHYYTGVKGADLESFREDLKASVRISQDKLGISPASLIFPRNQYNPEVIQVAKNLGFRCFRTNPDSWFWENTAHETLVKKVFRTGDTLFPLGKRTSYSYVQSGEIPASRLLRPYRKGSIFNQTRIDRIKSELELACKQNETYHLWWHPHNFGHFPEENLSILTELLKFIDNLKKEKGLASFHMSEYVELKDSYTLNSSREKGEFC